MKSKDIKTKLNEIEILKKNSDFSNCTLKELKSLPNVNCVLELLFDSNSFYMLNIGNDDAVPLKYLWRNNYEKLSMSLWFKLTRNNGVFFDVGAHTGVYTIVGNINNKINKIISIEPFYLNFCRLLSNLKLNNIAINNSFMAAASENEGNCKFKVPTNLDYHSAGGKISDNGNLSVPKVKIDNFKLESKILGIKIDTEGHEIEVLNGAQNSIKKDKPDIIFEINKNSFNKCLKLLKKFDYNFYFIDELKNELIKIDMFSDKLLMEEGSNCYATINQI
tara:strand:+ start:56 stop:886 length:831 start_codon:yes stop_codon:yes gene_type:complete